MTPKTACPIRLIVGYVATLAVATVLCIQRPELVLQNKVPSLAVQVVVGDLQATITSLSPSTAALPAESETSYVMTYGLAAAVGADVETAPMPKVDSRLVILPSTLSVAVAPGSTYVVPAYQHCAVTFLACQER